MSAKETRSRSATITKRITSVANTTTQYSSGLGRMAKTMEITTDSFPPFTVWLRATMTARKIPLDPARIVAGLKSANCDISDDAARRHLTAEGGFKGRVDTRLKNGYAAWLHVAADTIPTTASESATDEAIDDLWSGAESAARATPKDAHTDLDALLRSENSGLVKFVLRRLRQLTPTRP